MQTENRGLLIVLGVLVLVVLAGPLLGGGMMGPGMTWGYDRGVPPGTGGWTWGLAMGLGGLAMLAFWGALIVGAVLLVRWLGTATSGPSRGAGDSAIEILKRRYAAGEISHEEFMQMRQALER